MHITDCEVMLSRRLHDTRREATDKILGLNSIVVAQRAEIAELRRQLRQAQGERNLAVLQLAQARH